MPWTDTRSLWYNLNQSQECVKVLWKWIWLYYDKLWEAKKTPVNKYWTDTIIKYFMNLAFYYMSHFYIWTSCSLFNLLRPICRYKTRSIMMTIIATDGPYQPNQWWTLHHPYIMGLQALDNNSTLKADSQSIIRREIYMYALHQHDYVNCRISGRGH